MKHKLIAVASITVLLCMVLGNIVACCAAPTIEYSLCINSTGGGSVTTPGEGTFTYDRRTVVNLVAVGEEYYPFRNWTGDVDTIDDVDAAETTITMLDNYSITANFAQSPVEIYSKYGFSFEYPKGFSVTEMGYLESEANDNSGIVEVSVVNEKYESFSVGWSTWWPEEIESAPGGLDGWLEGALERMFETLEKELWVSIVEEGEFVKAVKSGHPIFYQDYTIFTIIENFNLYGVAGVFYCDISLRVFELQIYSSEEDVLEDFQNYLDSFVCH